MKVKLPLKECLAYEKTQKIPKMFQFYHKIYMGLKQIYHLFEKLKLKLQLHLYWSLLS